MALALEPLLRCPACRGEVGGANGAALACSACGRRYYLAAFERAGLRFRRVQPGINELRYRVASAVARVPKVGMTLAAVGELSVVPYAGVTIFARKSGG